jgi:methyl-accepting chemotaxis protein
LLAAVMVGLCGYWSFVLKKRSHRDWETHEQTLIVQMENLQKNIAFADAISRGDLEAEYEVTNDQDVMGKSLLTMKENLLAARANERREKFINTGLAQMGDILRSGSDVETLSHQIISGLVKYLKANQGGLFILEGEDSEPYLELAACYAYERRKHLHKRIEVGEGLVGQAVQEGEKLYLTDVPADYVNITSGLGKATPRCILIVPLKANEQVEGVIELASFQAFEPFEVDFVEKLAESIALAVRDQKTNVRTRRLLERSQVQAEALRSQEEEMRQNMEEMAATQEELARKESESAVLVSAVNQSLAAVRFDGEGNIETANEMLLRTMGYSLDEVQGRHHRLFVAADEAKSEAYRLFWEKLRRGEQFVGEVRRVSKSGKTVWLNATYTPIKDASGVVTGIIKLARDITSERENRKWLEQQAEQMRGQEEVLRHTLEELMTTQAAVEDKTRELAAARLEIERLQTERTERAG